MDAAAAGDKRRSGRGRLDGPSSSRGPGRSSGGPSRGGNAGVIKAQQAIIRGLGARQANVLDSRITFGGTTLQIEGLSSSKAASNPDGGMESLLGFLERKASERKADGSEVKIKKVC